MIGWSGCGCTFMLWVCGREGDRVSVSEDEKIMRVRWGKCHSGKVGRLGGCWFDEKRKQGNGEMGGKMGVLHEAIMKH